MYKPIIFAFKLPVPRLKVKATKILPGFADNEGGAVVHIQTIWLNENKGRLNKSKGEKRDAQSQ